MTDKTRNTMSRREFLKAAGLTTGALAAGSLLGGCAPKPTPAPTPTPAPAVPAAPSFEGATVRWLTGSGHNAVMARVTAPIAKKELGINVVHLEEGDGVLYELAIKDWQTGGGAYDIVTYHPRWNAEYQGLGYVIPLNSLMDKYDGWEVYNNVIPMYRQLYCEWAGKVYAFVVDGDVAQVYYRKDIFENPDINSKFKAKYGYDLKAPETYDELFQMGEFFKGWDWPGEGKTGYGLQIPSWKKDDAETTWAPMFWSAGGKYFDDEMNPLINSEPGVRALEDLKRILGYAPPGSIDMGWSETLDGFISGEIAVCLWYPDIGRLIWSPESWGGAGGPQWHGKIGYDLWPGYEVEGKLLRYCSMHHGRVISITKFAQDPDAAFQVLKLAERHDVVMQYSDNPASGQDPFLESQTDPKAWTTLDVEKEYLDTHVKAMGYGNPELQLPGNSEYYDALRTAVHGYLTGAETDPKAALDKAAATWDKITDKWGRDSQKRLWVSCLERYRKAGLKV